MVGSNIFRKARPIQTVTMNIMSDAEECWLSFMR